MKILRALGWGLLIIIIRNSMPEVFHGFERTLILFFQTIGDALQNGPPTF